MHSEYIRNIYTIYIRAFTHSINKYLLKHLITRTAKKYRKYLCTDVMQQTYNLKDILVKQKYTRKTLHKNTHVKLYKGQVHAPKPLHKLKKLFGCNIRDTNWKLHLHNVEYL